MATGIPNDDISTSDISDIVLTRQPEDEAGDWDKEDSELSHERRKITGSKNGKGKGSLGTQFDGNSEAVEELKSSINNMDSDFDDDIPASLEVRKKDRIAANVRKRTAERKSTNLVSPLPNNSSSNTASRKGNLSLSGNGRSESQSDMLDDSSTSSNSKSSSRRMRSANGNMMSPSTPTAEKVKLKLISPRRSRRSPVRPSRRERKLAESAPTSLELPSQSAAEKVECVSVVQSSLLHPPFSASPPNSPAGSTSRMPRGKRGSTPGAGHPQTMQAIRQPTQMMKEEITILSQSTQSTHSVESAHSQDSTDNDSNANADAPECDAGIEEVAKDHNGQQKTETAYSQPKESPGVSLKIKSARIPSTPVIALDESSMSLLDTATLQAEAAAIRTKSFEKKRITKITGGSTMINDSHYSTKNGERDEERSGLKSISSLDSSKLEDSSYATEELIPVDYASEAGWHPVVEQDSLKSSVRRNDDETTYPKHETEKIQKGRLTVGETLAHGKKNTLHISAHSEDSSMRETSKMEGGPAVMVPVLQNSRWLPAVEEEHDVTLPTADTVITSSKTQQFESDDDEVAESETLELASDSSSAKKVADSLLKKAAMKSVTDDGNLNDSYPPTDKSVGDQREDRKMIPSIDDTLPGEPQIDLESESGWQRVPVGQSSVAHGKHLQEIYRPRLGTRRAPKLGNKKRQEGSLALHGSQTKKMEEDNEMHMLFQVGDFSNVDNLKTIEGRSGIEKLGNRLIKEEMKSTQKSTEEGRKETKSAKNNGSLIHFSRSAKADTHSETDDDVKVATSFAETIADDSLYKSPSQEEYGTTNASSPPKAPGPLDTRHTGFSLGTELASLHVNTTTESSECCESEAESSDDDKDKKGARRDRRPIDSDVHALQSMSANNLNSPSTVQRKLGGPGLRQGHDTPGGRSVESLDRYKGLQQASSQRSLLRQKVNSRREVLTSMLQATTKKTHSAENEVLDLKRKLALSQALVQQLEVDNSQIRRQAVLDVARVQMIVQTKRHNHETELESQIKELIIERSAAVQESHELRMIIMDSCAACQNRLPDREFEMDDSVRRTIMGRRYVRRSSAFEWLAGNLAEETQDLEESSSAASRILNSKGRRFHDESDTYSLTSTLPDTGSIARSNLSTFGEGPLHWLSSKILKKGGQEKDDMSESGPPMIERVITYNTVSADANGDEHKSPSSVHHHGKDSAVSVETSDTGNDSSVDPKLLASASVSTNSYTSDAKSVEGHLVADKEAGGSFTSNGSVSGEQASKSKHVFGQVPQPTKRKTFFGGLLGEKAKDEFPSLALQAEEQTKLAKEKQTARKSRFSLFGSLMAEQVEDDILLSPNSAAVKPILQDKPDNGISKDSDNGREGMTASGAVAQKKGLRGLLGEQVEDDEDLTRLVPSSAAKPRDRVSATNDSSSQEVQFVGWSKERLNGERVEDDMKTRGSNVGREGSTGVANHGGKVGSPGIKSGAVQRVTDSMPAPWRPAPLLDDSTGNLSFTDNKGNSDQDPLEKRDSYGNLGIVDVDLIGSRPWLNDAGKRARKDAKKARNDDNTSNQSRGRGKGILDGTKL